MKSKVWLFLLQWVLSFYIGYLIFQSSSESARVTAGVVGLGVCWFAVSNILGGFFKAMRDDWKGRKNTKVIFALDERHDMVEEVPDITWINGDQQGRELLDIEVPLHIRKVHLKVDKWASKMYEQEGVLMMTILAIPAPEEGVWDSTYIVSREFNPDVLLGVVQEFGDNFPAFFESLTGGDHGHKRES